MGKKGTKKCDTHVDLLSFLSNLLLFLMFPFPSPLSINHRNNFFDSRQIQFLKFAGCFPSSETQGQLFGSGERAKKIVFKYGQKSPWVPTLTKLFPKLQADAGSWLGTKNALYYCAQSANSFSWVLFVSSYTTANVLPRLPGSFTKLVRARETFIFYRS